MLENWLKPVPTEDWLETLGSFTLGKNLDIHTAKGVPPLKKTKVALVFIGGREMQAIREELYPLTQVRPKLSLADLGNLKRSKISFGIPLIKELLDSHIIPLVIASDPNLVEMLYDAYKELHPYPSMLQVDEQLHLAKGERTRRLLDKRPFHLSILGGQGHFFQPEEVRLLEKRHFDLIRLGKAKAQIPDIEPIIRDADLISFNLPVLKPSEIPGLDARSPSGFQLEEGCQILRYSGLSDKLKACLITGFSPEAIRHRLSAASVAQLIWYFIEGVSQRKRDYPASTRGMTEYLVQVKNLDYQLVFWKSNKTGRWWMQIPVDGKAQQKHHRLVPCAYSDYVMARQGELPDRLLHALNRFS